MTTKILHTADVHLDSPLKSLALLDPDLKDRIQTATRSAFTRIVDTALAESVDALLIAGDLFDGAARSAKTAVFLTSQLDRLRSSEVRVFYIKGNHDAKNSLTGDLDLPENVHVFDNHGGKVQLTNDIWIHGVSFADRHVSESLLPKFSTPVEGSINIAMLHTSLAGAEGHDLYAPCTVKDLVASGFDYWALGHVHRRQVHNKEPWVVMPGIPQGRDIGEFGPKFATMLTIDETIQITEVLTSSVEFLHIPIDITEVESDDALRDMLRQSMREASDTLISESGVVRLSLTGSNPLRWQILRDQEVWREAIAEYARETDRLWLEKLVINLLDTNTPGQSATDELATIMEAIRQEPRFAESSRTELEKILKELTPQRRGELMPDESAVNNLTQHLAEAGSQRMLALMKGSTT